MSGASSFVVSCGLRLSEVGLSEIRKPQVKCQGTVLVTVRSRFWSRFGIYLNHTQSLSVDENSRCWFADSCSSSLSIALNRNISISPFKARALGSSPRRLTTSDKRQTRQNGFGVGGSLVHVRCTPWERLDTASIPVVDRPLAKAGVRLAKLLNEALGKKYAGGVLPTGGLVTVLRSSTDQPR